jgi:cytochrome c biogenesis protein CcdA
VKKVLKLILIAALFGLCAKAGLVFAQDKPGIDFFYSVSCHFCQQEEAFLDALQSKYPQLEIRKHEISEPESRELYKQMASERGVPQEAISLLSIPLTIVGDKYFVGFFSQQTTGSEIENQIKSILPSEKETPVSVLSLPMMGIVFGLANGFNPCTISVLILLLSYLLSSASLRQAVKSGTVFILSVFVFYFLLMLGVYKGFSFFQENLSVYLAPLKVFLGAILILLGFWMAKDFFFLKKGEKVSLAIPEFAKPLIKRIASVSTLPAAVLLALFSSLVELPCSFALPLSYTTLIVEYNASPYSYLFLYNFFFVLPLIVILALVGLGISGTESVSGWKESFKTSARLMAGALLMLLGLAFIFRIF